ncbi:MAG: glycosyltransferase family 39 protein, partial [Pseudomonadota bacterium]
YPAMALLGGWAIEKMIDGQDMPISRYVSGALFVIGGGALLLVSSPLAVELVQLEAAGDFKTVEPDAVLAQWSGQSGFPLGLWLVGGAAFGAATLAFLSRWIVTSLLLGVVASLVLGWHARIHFLPTQLWVQATETGRAALTELCGLPGEDCSGDDLSAPERILAVGYAEPSYVMTLGTQNLHPPETPIGLPNDMSGGPIVYLINLEDPDGQPALDQLTEEAAAGNHCVTQSAPHFALNYSNGDPVHFVAVRFDAGPCLSPNLAAERVRFELVD